METPRQSERLWLCAGVVKRWRVVSGARDFGEFDRVHDAEQLLALLVAGNPHMHTTAGLGRPQIGDASETALAGRVAGLERVCAELRDDLVALANRIESQHRLLTLRRPADSWDEAKLP